MYFPIFVIVEMLALVRPDRDEFIRVNEDNINPLMRNNFVKREHGDADFFTKGSVNSGHTPYDVLSEHKLWEKYFNLFAWPSL